MRLVIISHTEHYKLEDGSIVGLGSTITEINHLLDIFDDIIHLAMMHSAPAPASALPYASKRIHFVPLPTVGGRGLFNKLNILWNAPKTLVIVKRHLKSTDYFQFRAPTGIGVFVIPYLLFFAKNKGWFKYAGNWNQPSPPMSYRFQRWLLIMQHRKVTINGQWPKQPRHCLTFENPCLTTHDLEEGKLISAHKPLQAGAINLCFVGRLEAEKGINLLFEALLLLPKTLQKNIATVYIVGEGPMKHSYETKVNYFPFSLQFLGAISRQDVFAIYKDSHFIVLPSASEGFPKVISEALNYGCVPIVSDISSLSQYMTHDVQAFLLPDLKIGILVKTLEKALELPNHQYQFMLEASKPLLKLFTYDYYNKRIINELL